MNGPSDYMSDSSNEDSSIVLDEVNRQTRFNQTFASEKPTASKHILNEYSTSKIYPESQGEIVKSARVTIKKGGNTLSPMPKHSHNLSFMEDKLYSVTKNLANQWEKFYTTAANTSINFKLDPDISLDEEISSQYLATMSEYNNPEEIYKFLSDPDKRKIK